MNNPLPHFELPATSGTVFNPADFRGRYLVIYFYPKDNTPGCTNQGKDFRDYYTDFKANNCAIIGISRDSLKSHENFKAKFEFPFELASDTDETVCTLFNVIKMKKLYGKEVRGIERSTFLIDPDGQLVKAWRGVKVDGHVQAVLETVKMLSSQ